VKLAHLFLALTAVRLEALRGARWDEIEDLDGAAPIWRVPAARMKLARSKKGEAAFDHMVPLAPAAVTILRAARLANRGGALIFPGRAGTRPIGEAAIGALIARAGYQGRHVPHGWRASFSTVMNERFPLERSAIDEALAHGTKGKVEAAYNRAQQLARRRDLFERWANLIIDRPVPSVDRNSA
jgi:integrase